MPRGNLPQISVVMPLLFTELFQGFFLQLTKISDFHSSTLYNIGIQMSRKIKKHLKWGKILREIRKSANLTQTDIADALGYRGNGKGNVSEIEQGKLPIDEEKIRIWVEKCNKTMFDFYMLATKYEAGTFLLESFSPHKKSE